MTRLIPRSPFHLMDTRIHTPACLIQRPEGNCDLCTWIRGHAAIPRTCREARAARATTRCQRGNAPAALRSAPRARDSAGRAWDSAGRAQERAACSLAHAQAERLHEQGHALVARRQLLDGPQRLPIRLGIWMGTELDESEDRMVVSLLHIPQVGLIEGYGLEAEELSEALEGNQEAREICNQDAIEGTQRPSAGTSSEARHQRLVTPSRVPNELQARLPRTQTSLGRHPRLPSQPCPGS